MSYYPTSFLIPLKNPVLDTPVQALDVAKYAEGIVDPGSCDSRIILIIIALSDVFNLRFHVFGIFRPPIRQRVGICYRIRKKPFTEFIKIQMTGSFQFFRITLLLIMP